jgi:hypothetical protein
MDNADAPRTTRARTGLALFGAIFGFDDGDARDDGDRRGDAGGRVRTDGGERDR